MQAAVDFEFSMGWEAPWIRACVGSSVAGARCFSPPAAEAAALPPPGKPLRSTATGSDAGVHVIAATTDGSGDFYVGGAFTTYSTAAYKRLVRLLPSGAPDFTFVNDRTRGQADLGGRRRV